MIVPGDVTVAVLLQQIKANLILKRDWALEEKTICIKNGLMKDANGWQGQYLAYKDAIEELTKLERINNGQS